MGSPTEFRLFRADEGRTFRLDGLTLTFKHDGPPDGEACSVCVAVSDPDWGGARLHRHGYEEWHIQLEGRCCCQLGDDTVVLDPGDMIHFPSWAPHGLKPTGTPARQLLISAPAGIFEGFVADIAALQAGPPRPHGKREIEAISRKYGIEFLGPSWS
jgi:mannose-6-phosphate isomerase-like protein (cupin superfamily)